MEADIQEVLISYAADLTEDDLEWLTMLSVPDDKVDSDTVVERLLRTSSALMKGVQKVDDWVDHFLEANQFVDRCLKFQQEMGDAVAP